MERLGCSVKETLQDAVVLVTGGAGGLGLVLAAEAGRRGAKLMLADVVDATDVAAELRDQGVEVDWMQVDMTDYDQVTALVERTLQRFGSLNILCNNAGIGAMGGLDQIDPGQAKTVLDVNILGYFHAIHACARTLKEAVTEGGPAFILNTGSEHSLGVPPHVWPISIYTTSKYAVLGLTDTARRDLGLIGIGVSLLAPGWVLTEKVRGTWRPTNASPQRSSLMGRRRRRWLVPPSMAFSQVSRSFSQIPWHGISH